MADPFEAIVGMARVDHPADAKLDGVTISTVVRPETPEQVAACLKTAGANGRAVIASGSGSKLGWGNRADVDSRETARQREKQRDRENAQ